MGRVMEPTPDSYVQRQGTSLDNSQDTLSIGGFSVVQWSMVLQWCSEGVLVACEVPSHLNLTSEILSDMGIVSETVSFFQNNKVTHIINFFLNSAVNWSYYWELKSYYVAINKGAAHEWQPEMSGLQQAFTWSETEIQKGNVCLKGKAFKVQPVGQQTNTCQPKTGTNSSFCVSLNVCHKLIFITCSQPQEFYFMLQKAEL